MTVLLLYNTFLRAPRLSAMDFRANSGVPCAIVDKIAHGDWEEKARVEVVDARLLSACGFADRTVFVREAASGKAT